jgi:hypothetical protein
VEEEVLLHTNHPHRTGRSMEAVRVPDMEVDTRSNSTGSTAAAAAAAIAAVTVVAVQADNANHHLRATGHPRLVPDRRHPHDDGADLGDGSSSTSFLFTVSCEASQHSVPRSCPCSTPIPFHFALFLST